MRHDDVRTVGAATLVPVDLICGGFPCQPVSVAGKREAQRDPRWLWPHFARIVHELRPGIVVIENVPGLRTAGLRDVLADLAALGLDAEWSYLSASQIGAPHLRRRLFVVATDPKRVPIREQPGWLCRAFGAAVATVDRHAAEKLLAGNTRRVGLETRRPEIRSSARRVPDPRRDAANPNDMWRLESAIRLSDLRGWPEHCGWRWDLSERVHDGVSKGMVGARRKALGNAVVPQCAEVVGRVIVGLVDSRR